MQGYYRGNFTNEKTPGQGQFASRAPIQSIIEIEAYVGSKCVGSRTQYTDTTLQKWLVEEIMPVPSTSSSSVTNPNVEQRPLLTYPRSLQSHCAHHRSMMYN